MNNRPHLEVFNSFNFELQSGIFITDKQSSWMLLDGRHSPHVIDALFDSFVKRQRFMGSRYQHHHL